MPFEVRIGASKYDRAEYLDAYNRLEKIAHEFGFTWLRQSTLVSLIETFGAEKTEWGIRRLHGRGNYSLDTLVGIIEGRIAAQRSAPTQSSVAPQAQRTGGGPRSADEFLDTNPPRIKKPKATVKTPSGLYKMPEVERYLGERGIAIKDVHDYFTYFGVDTAGNDLWTLLPQHLLPKEHDNNN